MTAWKGGARSANGLVSRSATCSMPWASTARPALLCSAAGIVGHPQPVEGDFDADYDPEFVAPTSIEQVPVKEQPDMLTQAAMEFCLADAFHPQTILAYALNGGPLPMGNGAPLRLRVERQLGYKHAKFVWRIEVVADLGGVHGGKGGFWEDLMGYEWYAGI